MNKIRTDSISLAPQLNDDLLYEILVHLPSYSLMRFKCVSKLWNSIIRNPYFAKDRDLRGGCFRGLLVIHTPKDGRYIMRLYNANVNDSNCTFFHNSTFDLSNRTHIFRTHIVKSLVGFYSVDNFTLCNITTQEFTDLPDTKLPNNTWGVYHLGFDPVEDVYKVLYIYDGMKNNVATSLACVFTVGKDSAWRKIGTFPVRCVCGVIECHCISGTLYFPPSREIYSINNRVELSMIAFNLNSESCEIIPVSQDIPLFCTYVAEIGGNPAVLSYDENCNPREMDVWVMMKTDSRTGSRALWTHQKVEFPIANLNYVGMIPTGELLFAHKSMLLIYTSKYDHNKNKLELIKLDGHSARVENWDNLCYYEESIMPLGSLIKM